MNMPHLPWNIYTFYQSVPMDFFCVAINNKSLFVKSAKRDIMEITASYNAVFHRMKNATVLAKSVTT